MIRLYVEILLCKDGREQKKNICFIYMRVLKTNWQSANLQMGYEVNLRGSQID